MLVLDLDGVIVVHAHGTGPEVAHAVLTPLELAMDRAVSQQRLLELNALVYLFVPASTSIAS